MPNVDLREMDVAVLRCLHRVGGAGMTPAELLPMLQKDFPGNDEVEMREGIAITRLRGRTLVVVGEDGRVRLTEEGAAAVAGL
jgi:hypothetical protein